MDRFWNKVNKTETCWLWTKSTRSGYGAFKLNGKVVSAHRYIYELTYNCSVLPWIDVCHTCDNKLCVNPGHLFLGTRKDNMIDCIQKKRFAYPPSRANTQFKTGFYNPNTKLSTETVKEIRLRYSTENISLRKLAKQYDVDHSRIWQIVRGLDSSGSG